MIFIHRTGYFQAIDINSSRPLIYIYDKIESSAVILNLLPITIIGNSLTEKFTSVLLQAGEQRNNTPSSPQSITPYKAITNNSLSI